MIKKRKVIVIDVDGTITLPREGEEVNYESVPCSQKMRTKLLQLKSDGFWIVLYSSRNMRTHEGNIGLIIKHTAPILINWLANNDIPYDELHFGKPWCGEDGFYVDDRAIRPREFIEMSMQDIRNIIEKDRLDS